ncbi:recombinase family protein [Kitasatospora cineracea]
MVPIQPGTFGYVEPVAVGYDRQSKAKADKTEASPLVQKSANRAKANELKARFLRHYSDIGISGWNPDAYREGFEKMLNAARAGDFNMLVVYDVSRFSRREVMDAIPIVTELHRLGITIVSCLDGVFAPGDTMALIYLIMRMDAVNKESEHKSQKVRDTKNAQRAEGSWLGGRRPYGFTVEKYFKGKLALMRLVPEESEAANIRRIWALIKAHKDQAVSRKKGSVNMASLTWHCEYMNERPSEYPTQGRSVGKERATSQWNARTLKGILRNPVIAGLKADPVYKLTERGNRSGNREWKIQRDESGHPIVICEAIIPLSEWYELQAWLDTRVRGAGVARRTSLLSGLRNVDNKPVLTCGCGRPQGALNNGEKPTYRCTRNSRVPAFEGDHLGKNAIMQVHANDYVARRVYALIQSATGSEPDDEAVEILREATLVYSMAQETPETSRERTSMVAERADAQAALKALWDDFDSGDVYEGAEGRKRFKTKRLKCESRLRAAEARLAELSDMETVGLPLELWLRPGDDGDPIGPGSWWADASLEERRNFLTLFVYRITISPAGADWRASARYSFDVSRRITLEWVTARERDEDETEEAQEAA